MDTADTDGVLNLGDSDVTLFTPDGGPGVLDDPVTLSALVSVTNSEDGVVKGGSALLGGEDSGMVGLEDSLVSLNGDGDGLQVEGRLEGINVAGLDHNIGVGTNLTLGGIVGAVTIEGGVRVVSLEHERVGLCVIEGSLLETTVATKVQISDTLGAVNEVLLGKRDEVTSGNEVGTFESTSGGESPA